MNYSNLTRLTFFFAALLIMSCGDDDDAQPSIDEPATYTFERAGTSTVSFDGQTTRIMMADELINAMKDFDNATVTSLTEMYANEKADGSDADPFSDASLNSSTKSVRSKVAASKDFFSSNTAEAAEIKADFQTWIEGQVNAVFPKESDIATPGVPGQIADGSSARYINGNGLEFNQMVNKGLIGALMADQTLNNYLSPAVLDEADNREKNDAGTNADGKDYTTMEHKWDEAYGYLYGTAADKTNPNATLGADDAFLNKYIGRVRNDDDFASIGDDIYNAFKRGRAAIVAGEYEVRDEQADIIKEKISEVIAVRAVYYLQAGKNALPTDGDASKYGTAFHDLSEGFGFIYSLRFTNNPNTDAPYFSKSEVDGFIDQLLGDGANGLWDVTPATLDAISDAIAAKFDFTVDQAAN